MKKNARIAIMIGDPAGIGPEVVLKSLVANPEPAHILLIGDAGVVRNTASHLRIRLDIRSISHVDHAHFEAGVISVLDPGTFDRQAFKVGQVSAECGRAVVEWWDVATRLALDRKVDAVIKAPVNFESIRLSRRQPAVDSGGKSTHLLLIAGTLRVAHLTDHIPLRTVFSEITQSRILDLILLTHRALTSWGVASPRIGVAGLNPHAVGTEEAETIGPAVQAACAQGVCVEGPIAPDSLFRQCLDGRFDCVLAHYHDQGHIAVKTNSAEGNCAIVLGEPFLRLSVAHGTAFDIAGKGIADPGALLMAIQHAASLGSGRGFPIPSGAPPGN
ncbi:MAG: 4-hydroxythreonine-4-phosphate dehydrogenase PdxA [Pigmentiphaga sp.]|nr:4-hydroxythreonine-4-phosphate dehydrogenase PdxA [Pigmentiphaga sp.]